MNNTIKLRLFCQEESFRSEFAARLLTFYGISNKSNDKNIMSEDDVIDKLESQKYKEVGLKFMIEQYQFEIVWKNDIGIEEQTGQGNFQTMFLLLLQLKQQISENVLECLKEYEIQKNCLFVIVDKLSNSTKDTEVQLYENGVLDTLNSNLNVLVQETHILTVLPQISEKSKVLICDKFKEVANSIFEITQESLDNILEKICLQYNIEKVDQFIEQVKKGDFSLGCAKVKDRKARKVLMEILKSLKELNQFIMQNKKSQIKSETEGDVSETPGQQKKLIKVQSQNVKKQTLNTLFHQNNIKKSESVKQPLKQENQQFEDIISQTVLGKSECRTLDTQSKVQWESLIKEHKDVTKSHNYSKYRKTVDSISQLKWAVSQDLIDILKNYVADPEAYLDCLFAEKIYEVLKDVKKSEQHIFLQRINACQSYQQYLNVINKQTGKSSAITQDSVSQYVKNQLEQVKVSSSQINFRQTLITEKQTPQEQVKCNLVKQIKTDGSQVLLKQSVKETEGKFDENGNKYVGQYKNGLRDGKGELFYANGDKYTGQFKNGLREGKGYYEFADGGHYDGQFYKDKREGKGLFLFSNGGIYDGQWKNHVREGKGTFQYANGEKYEGEWKNNKREGQGMEYYPSGQLFYKGQWKNDEKEGHGTLYFPNGCYYKGEFKNGKRNGQGTTFRADEEPYYTGEWKNDAKDGKGTIWTTGGDTYEGDWKDNERHGMGTLQTQDGERYEGEWKNNEKHGIGCYYYLNNDRYEGEWKNGKASGKGTKYFDYGGKLEAIWQNGFNCLTISKDKYEGSYKNGLRDGIGMQYYGNGDMYVGEWKNNLKEGEGTYFYNDGTIYEGSWKKDMKSGKGTLHYENNFEYQGEFKNDQRHGIGIETNPYGSKTKGKWENDKLIKQIND